MTRSFWQVAATLLTRIDASVEGSLAGHFLFFSPQEGAFEVYGLLSVCPAIHFVLVASSAGSRQRALCARLVWKREEEHRYLRSSAGESEHGSGHGNETMTTWGAWEHNRVYRPPPNVPPLSGGRIGKTGGSGCRRASPW